MTGNADRREGQGDAQMSHDELMEACRQLDPSTLGLGDRHLLAVLGIMSMDEALGPDFRLEEDGTLVQRVTDETIADIDRARREALAAQ